MLMALPVSGATCCDPKSVSSSESKSSESKNSSVLDQSSEDCKNEKNAKKINEKHLINIPYASS